MNCPKCNSPLDCVIDKRDVVQVNAIRRRRKCLSCEHRWTTYETIPGTGYETESLQRMRKIAKNMESVLDMMRNEISKAAE